MEHLPGFTWLAPGQQRPDPQPRWEYNPPTLPALGWAPPAEVAAPGVQPHQSQGPVVNPESESQSSNQQIGDKPGAESVIAKTPIGPPTLGDGSHTNTAVGSDIHSITAQIKSRLTKLHKAAKEESESEAESAESAAQPPSKKMKTGGGGKLRPKPAAAPTNPKKAAAPSKPKASDVEKFLKEVQGKLPYRDPKKHEPRYIGEITIYTDTKLKIWRIKPGCGRRDEKKVSFRKEPRVQWQSVLKKVAGYMAVE